MCLTSEYCRARRRRAARQASLRFAARVYRLACLRPAPTFQTGSPADRLRSEPRLAELLPCRTLRSGTLARLFRSPASDSATLWPQFGGSSREVRRTTMLPRVQVTSRPSLLGAGQIPIRIAYPPACRPRPLECWESGLLHRPSVSPQRPATPLQKLQSSRC